MIRRRLFSTRRRASGTGGFGASEIRNPERELVRFRRRLAIAGGAVLVAFAVLVGRFAYLQVAQHGHFRTLAETNRIAIVPIAPNRGVITDRNGVCSRRATRPTRSRSSARACSPATSAPWH